jgi:predicted acetyltransferase
MLGSHLRRRAATWRTEEGFAAYVAALRADALEETPRPTGWVPCTTWWWTAGDAWLGRIALRHRLTPRLLEAGGHIGYDVRPSARRRGYATAMLRAVLPQARALGIASLLVTCEVDNLGSRRVIELNGGRLEDERGGKLRFWLPSDPTTEDAQA